MCEDFGSIPRWFEALMSGTMQPVFAKGQTRHARMAEGWIRRCFRHLPLLELPSDTSLAWGWGQVVCPRASLFWERCRRRVRWQTLCIT